MKDLKYLTEYQISSDMEDISVKKNTIEVKTGKIDHFIRKKFNYAYVKLS